MEGVSLSRPLVTCPVTATVWQRTGVLLEADTRGPGPRTSRGHVLVSYGLFVGRCLLVDDFWSVD